MIPLGLAIPLVGIALMVAWTVGIVAAFAFLDWRNGR